MQSRPKFGRNTLDVDSCMYEDFTQCPAGELLNFILRIR